MSSDSDEENVIRYGTPLEPYEEDEIPSKRKFKPADEYAVDEHGRRRFHGAFTGGFSAGFGNTVGSQEGWTPSTFKSSRSEKAQISNQKPEDFMDEEDRGEFGIAPRQIQTQSEFSGQKRQRGRAYHDGTIPGEPVLEQLLRPVHETAAVKMLKAMGWRPGQGTGERLTKQQKKKMKQQQKVYGCYVPPELRTQTADQSDESTDSEYDYDTLFAPDDYEPYTFVCKADRFGLGYKGLSRHSVLGNLVGEYGSEGTTSHLVMKEKGKKISIRGQAFGVGAFEADDEDIYATEDMSHYDFTMGPAPPEPKKQREKTVGRVLEGFVRSSKPLPSVPPYPPPALPRNYVPAPAGTRRTRFEPTHAPQRDQGLGRHELTAEARGALLGEEPIPKPVEPTPATKTTLAEDLIAKITGRNVAFVTQSQKTPETSGTCDSKHAESCRTNAETSKTNAESSKTNAESSRTSNVKTIESSKILNVQQVESNIAPDFISIKDSGKDIKNVFKPFASNPLKQKRYEVFLANGSVVRDSDADRVSEWERERELLEFEQAAKLYRPLSGVMGDRFTHATEPDDALNPLTAVSKSKNNYGLATKEQIEAAEKGVYGVLTRSKTSWRPESIVCKRFNVPEPGVTRLEPSKNEKQKISYSVFSYLESSVHDKDSFAKEQSTFSGSKSVNRPIRVNETHQNQSSTPQSSNTSKPLETNDPKTKLPEKIEITEKITSQNIPKITQNSGPMKRMTVAELFLKESEKNKAKGEEVTETINKFDKMDLYKSIFLSDSEEEAFEASKDKKDDPNINTVEFVEKPKNVLRNTSPPRGIFANIDFDELNSWKRTDKAETSHKDNSSKDNIAKDTSIKDSNKDGATARDNLAKDSSLAKNSNTTEGISNMDVDDQTYGPKIPENLMKRLESQDNDLPPKDNIQVIDSSSDSWVDANEVKSKKKKKKIKHKKDKKHKKKSKKKDR